LADVGPRQQQRAPSWHKLAKRVVRNFSRDCPEVQVFFKVEMEAIAQNLEEEEGHYEDCAAFLEAVAEVWRAPRKSLPREAEENEAADDAELAFRKCWGKNAGGVFGKPLMEGPFSSEQPKVGRPLKRKADGAAVGKKKKSRGNGSAGSFRRGSPSGSESESDESEWEQWDEDDEDDDDIELDSEDEAFWEPGERRRKKGKGGKGRRPAESESDSDGEAAAQFQLPPPDESAEDLTSVARRCPELAEVVSFVRSFAPVLALPAAGGSLAELERAFVEYPRRNNMLAELHFRLLGHDLGGKTLKETTVRWENLLVNWVRGRRLRMFGGAGVVFTDQGGWFGEPSLQYIDLPLRTRSKLLLALCEAWADSDALRGVLSRVYPGKKANTINEEDGSAFVDARTHALGTTADGSTFYDFSFGADVRICRQLPPPGSVSEDGCVVVKSASERAAELAKEAAANAAARKEAVAKMHQAKVALLRQQEQLAWLNEVKCEVCGSKEGEADLLLCGTEDGKRGCGCGYHLHCIQLDQIPEGDWFCPKCVASGVGVAQTQTQLEAKKPLKVRIRLPGAAAAVLEGESPSAVADESQPALDERAAATEEQAEQDPAEAQPTPEQDVAEAQPTPEQGAAAAQAQAEQDAVATPDGAPGGGATDAQGDAQGGGSGEGNDTYLTKHASAILALEWVQVLQQIQQDMRLNAGGNIREGIRKALKCEPPPPDRVARRLRRALTVYRGNSAGPCKRIALEALQEHLVANGCVPENASGCYRCGSSSRPGDLLICGDASGRLGCGRECHYDCARLPRVPLEDWFCPDCEVRMLSVTRQDEEDAMYSVGTGWQTVAASVEEAVALASMLQPSKRRRHQKLAKAMSAVAESASLPCAAAMAAVVDGTGRRGRRTAAAGVGSYADMHGGDAAGTHKSQRANTAQRRPRGPRAAPMPKAPGARCAACAKSKKGGCGTEKADRRCLRRPELGAEPAATEEEPAAGDTAEDAAEDPAKDSPMLLAEPLEPTVQLLEPAAAEPAAEPTTATEAYLGSP